ncbi:FISUMP domain-containing protein, partial [candidate division KSB1 bacterium]
IAKKVAIAWSPYLVSSKTLTLQKPLEYSIVAPDNFQEGIIEIKDEFNVKTLAYVIELEPKGFIIVSPTINIYPIIGYSKTSNFDPTPIDQNVFLYFLKLDMSNRLKAIENGHMPELNISKAQSAWNKLLTDFEDKKYILKQSAGSLWDVEIGPLVTTTWGQSGNVFNIYTPNNWVSGCVATAAAQILKYYNWPPRGTSSHSYTEDDAGELSANFGNTTYTWNDMLNNYYNESSTQAQKEAAGLLVSHFGISVNMDYEEDGSAAFSDEVAKSFNSYFRTSGEYVRSTYSDFESRLYSNIISLKPGLLSIDGSGGGHAVIIDGVQNNAVDTLYHLNFGWSGTDDAWYKLPPPLADSIVTSVPPAFTEVNSVVLDIVPDPMFNIYGDTSETGNYTVSWDVSNKLNADKYELVEGILSSSTTTFSDGAESGIGNWSVNGNWESSTSWSYSGSNSFRGYLSPEAALHKTHKITINSKSFYIDSSTAITYYWRTNYFDGCEAYFQVSTDGEVWTTLKTYSQASQETPALEFTINLSDYIGENIFVRFAVTYKEASYYDGSAYNSIGFFVDDFTVANCKEVNWTTVDDNITGISEKSISGKADGTYYYKVRAFRDSRWWNWSNIHFTEVGTFTPPSVPALVSPSDSETGISMSPTLIWNTSTGAASYILQVSQYNNFSSYVYNQNVGSDTSKQISGLSGETTYYWRVSAANSVDTSSPSSHRSFTTIISITLTDIDGNVYQTVKIGNQRWMAENLKVTHYRNGDPIPLVTDGLEWETFYAGGYCNYNNDTSNVAVYGRLYNWYAATNYRKIAPEGWHLPTDDDWKELEMYLGISQQEVDKNGARGTDEGGKLKESGYTHWNSPNTGATNESGFTALPGGFRYFDDGVYVNMGSSAIFWSSTMASGSSSAYYRDLSYYYSTINRSRFSNVSGYSVRLVRDEYIEIYPPDNLGAVDNPDDNGGYIKLTFNASPNHPGMSGNTDEAVPINYYIIYRNNVDTSFQNAGKWAAVSVSSLTLGSNETVEIIVSTNGDNNNAYYWIAAAEVNSSSDTLVSTPSGRDKARPIDNTAANLLNGADFNADRTVDILDIGILLDILDDNSEYDSCMDLNSDGNVDVFDIGRVLDVFGQSISKNSVAKNNAAEFRTCSYIEALSDNNIEDLFDVSIQCSQIDNISGFEFVINYNPEDYELMNVNEGNINLDNNSNLFYFNESSKGKILIAGVLLDMTGDYEKSEYIITKLNFRLKGNSVSSIDINNIKFLDKNYNYYVQDQLNVKNSVIIPKEFSLQQNYPNPFNPETIIKYQVPELSGIIFNIYNTLGQKVRTLIDEEKQSGYYSVKWDGTNDYGVKVSSGIYIYVLKTDKGYIKARKMVFLK